MQTYTTKLIAQNKEDNDSLTEILRMEQYVFNEASKLHFGAKKNSIIVLHSRVYDKIRKEMPNIPSQVVIKAEQECLSSYRSVKSNKHKITKPIVKDKLSIRLDKRLYSKANKESIRITTLNGRKEFKFYIYPKLKELLDKYVYCDPLIFIRNNELQIAFTFKSDPENVKINGLALGVDLGMRVSAACSDGRLIIDKKYNKEKRKLLFLKRQLQSKGTKSARRHLNKIRYKEANKSKNQTYLIANEILKTKADTIVLEDLAGIKKKKYKHQNKRAISQVPFAKLASVLTYKAIMKSKITLFVCPKYTSQIDSATGNQDGKRCGRRFYSKSGSVYDADINAAINIGKRSNHPLSCGNVLDGAGKIVTLPNVYKPSISANIGRIGVVQAREFIRG